jgi:hypothetical protein
MMNTRGKYDNISKLIKHFHIEPTWYDDCLLYHSDLYEDIVYLFLNTG